MSVRTMSRVWDGSKHSGSELLMLLAIADFADDDGRAYPAVTTLAAKCRMRPRNANYVLSALKAGGELEIRVNEGPKGTNLYRIVLDRLGMQPAAPLQAIAPLQYSAPTPALHCAKPLHCIADEPSLNHQEPSVTSTARLPTCPHQMIVDLYHEVLPELPGVRVLKPGGKRHKAIQGLWSWVLTTTKGKGGERRATTEAEGLAWLRDYFSRARESDWVMGRTPRGPGHEKWEADIDYLCSEAGMKRVIERTRA